MKVRIALFFSIIFATLLIAPTVISLVDNTLNIAFVLDMNEEEENHGKKSAKNLEIKIQTTENCSNLLLFGIQYKKDIRFKSKNYTSEYPKITTPPPKFLS